MRGNVYLGSQRPKRGASGGFKAFLFLVLLGGLGFAGIATMRVGDSPKIDINSEAPAIGKRGTVQVSVSEPKRGLSTVKVELVQGPRTRVLKEMTFVPPPPWMLWADKTEETWIEAEVGKLAIPELEEGAAQIRVTAGVAGTWLTTPEPVVEALTLQVRITPPTLRELSSNVWVGQGGAEVVVYEVGKTSVKDGVRAGEWWFPGYPLPGGEPFQRFAFFGVPYDMDNVEDVKLVAEDELENRVEMDFIDKFIPRRLTTDTINVSDAVIQKIVPKIMAQVPSFKDRGSPVANYVAINSEMRRENNDRLKTIAAQTAHEFLWAKPFVQMSAKAVSLFADRRTYMHEGKKIDQQDHLGFDLASTQQAHIPAANSGVVMLSEFLGIYGDAVIIDHGYGLMSLYGHLSHSQVKRGEKVQRAQVIGRTGVTGLALGDHLHFTMLLQGLPVTPIEWWDGHWIEDRIVLKLGEALPFEPN